MIVIAGWQIRGGACPAASTESRIDKRHDRIDVGPAEGREHRDEHEEPERGGESVFEKLESDIVGGETL